jgi:hypothetical protein
MSDYELRGYGTSVVTLYCSKCGKPHERESESWKERPFATCHPGSRLQETKPEPKP